MAAATGGLQMGRVLVANNKAPQLATHKMYSDDEEERDDPDLFSQEESEWMAALSKEERDLIGYCTSFKPQKEEIDTTFFPFAIDMIPAVGDIDAFIKIPRPDEIEDNVGVVSLDEPATKQSDPVIVNMHMRTLTKDIEMPVNAAEIVPAKKLQQAHRDTQPIERWIENIKELHRSRPTTNVHYSRAMPDIEKLMQEWPSQLESRFHDMQLPTAELDVPLEEFVDIALSILDIPVHKSRIEALHLFFSLYAEFKNSQHFRNIGKTEGAPVSNVQRMEL